MSYRHCSEVIGWVPGDGALYCDGCFTGDRKEATPVFLGDEYPSSGDVCDVCLEYLDGHEAYCPNCYGEGDAHEDNCPDWQPGGRQ